MKNSPAPTFKWAVVKVGYQSRPLFRGPLAECIKRAAPGTVVVPA